jgi:hypothetical protein
MRALFVVLFAVVAASACAGDVVSNHYVSLQDARADRLFERGWLPDLLPPSSRDIRVVADLDTNVSSGEFHFAPGEFSSLSAKLHAYTKGPSPLVSLQSDVDGFIAKGYEAYEFADTQGKWVFLCKPDRGVCEYRSWLRSS